MPRKRVQVRDAKKICGEFTTNNKKRTITDLVSKSLSLLIVRSAQIVLTTYCLQNMSGALTLEDYRYSNFA